MWFVLLPGRRGVTLGKPDIKVETINKETHSLEEDSASVSTATRMVKAMYSVSFRGDATIETLRAWATSSPILSANTHFGSMYLGQA